jgi:hypothetical protein
MKCSAAVPAPVRRASSPDAPRARRPLRQTQSTFSGWPARRRRYSPSRTLSFVISEDYLPLCDIQIGRWDKHNQRPKIPDSPRGGANRAARGNQGRSHAAVF